MMMAYMLLEVKVEDNSSHTCTFSIFLKNKLTLLMKSMFLKRNHDVAKVQNIPKMLSSWSVTSILFVGFALPIFHYTSNNIDNKIQACQPITFNFENFRIRHM